MTIQSKINDSDGDDIESDPSRNPKVDTYTINVNYAQKLSNNRFIPKIVPGAIRPIDQLITEDVPVILVTLDAQQTVFSKEIFADTARSCTRIFRTPREVSQKGRDISMSRDINTAVATTRLTPPIRFLATVPLIHQCGLGNKIFSIQ